MAFACLLFGLSGSAALVYQVVWTRWLVLVFGATVQSMASVGGAFMAGLALGSWLGGKLAQRVRDPWKAYGLAELGIAALAALVPLSLQAILAACDGRALGAAARIALTFAALLPSTTLMGATFPLLARRFASADPDRAIGRLYAANLLGACLGTLVSAFVLVAFLGLSGTHWLAVALNALVGAGALLRPDGRRADSRAAPVPAASARAGPGEARVPLAALLVFSAGACGMGFEVVWLRVLLPSFNNSAYGLASVLFAMLAGLGAGSALAARLASRSLAGRSPAVPALAGATGVAGLGEAGAALAASGLCAYLGYGVYELSQLLQMHYVDMSGSTMRPILWAPLLEALAVLGPMATCQGMILPLAVRACPDKGARFSLARLYAFNSLGAIAGSLAAGFLLIPWLNVQNALLSLIAFAAVAGAATFAAGSRWTASRRWGAGLASVALAALGWRWTLGRHVPAQLLTEWLGRNGPKPNLLYYADDVEASVAVVRNADSSRLLVINGVGVAAYTNVTKMLAHLPLALHPAPERALVICFGIGTTFRSALQHPVRVDAAELVGAVERAFPFFYPDARRWREDPRARVFLNDGRNHLLADREGYDVIVVDPSPPLFAAGTVSLYDREFFELARRKLKPAGLLGVWLPEAPEEDFRMIMATFSASFPHVQFWRGEPEGRGLIMVGSSTPIDADKKRLRSRLREGLVGKDLLQFNPQLKSDQALWDLYHGPAERFRDYLAGAPIITDDRPWIEYPYYRSKAEGYLRPPRVLDWKPAPF